MTLPPCPARRTWMNQPEKFFCADPRLSVADQLVTPQICQICPYPNSPPSQSFRVPVVEPLADEILQATIGGSVMTDKRLSRPWQEYDCTVVVAHLDTPDFLELSIRGWQLQQERPFVLVVDTGSRKANSHKLLDRLAETPGVEVARLGIMTQVEHLSDRVAIALDYALSRCPTSRLLLTHVDVFPKHRELVEELCRQCNAETPVIGWEMSPRGVGDAVGGRGFLSDGIPGHVCTMLHVPTMDRIGAGWSIRRAHHAFGLPRGHTNVSGWPDTEVCLARILEQHGITPLHLGRETNAENQETADWEHVRSITSHSLVSGRLPRHLLGLRNARTRFRGWETESVGQRKTPPYTETLGLLSVQQELTVSGIEYRRRKRNRPTVTLFVPLSGRRWLWPMFAQFLEQQTWPHSRTRLMLLDTSHDPQFSQTVRDWLAACDYAHVRYDAVRVGAEGLADRSRPQHFDDVQSAMRRIHTHLVRELRTRWVWIVEDDVIPPIDACERLFASTNNEAASVSGVYRSRNGVTYSAWSDDGTAVTTPRRGVTEVGGNGFGCVLLRRDALRAAVKETRQGAVDTGFYRALRSQGWTARLDWTIECEHLVGEKAPQA